MVIPADLRRPRYGCWGCLETVHGRSIWYYEVNNAGYKMNPLDMLSTLGRVLLRKCDQF